MPRYLYFPMEIAAREMDSRLLTALYAAGEGMEVILGQKWLLQRNIPHVPRGVWMFKTLMPGDAIYMRKAKAGGHAVCAIDEEVTGLGEGCGGLRWVAPQALASCDRLFCLGQAHAGALAEKFPQESGKCVITGNPRWDLLRRELRGYYADQAEEIRRRHGRFILYNTNSGLANSANKSTDAFIEGMFRDGRLDASNPQDVQLAKDYKDFSLVNIEAARAIIRRLAEALPDVKIIVRPHPIEKLETYSGALKDLPNVEFHSGGAAAPWILASELLVHTSCSTGVEAFALGVPSISFDASSNVMNEQFLLSGQVSRRTSSIDELARWAVDLLAGKSDPALWRTPQMEETFHRFFAAQQGDFAARRIAREAARLAPESASETWKPGWLFRPWRWRKAFQKSIFPDISAAQLQKKVDAIARLANLPSMKARRIGRAMYHLKPQGKAR